MAKKRTKKSASKLSESKKTPSKKRAVKMVLSGKEKLLLYFAFILLTVVLYFQCFPFGYVLDDIIVISKNQFTKAGFSGIWDILSTESFSGYFGEQKNLVEGSRYRPLSIVTFAFEHQLFGLNPTISHVINVLLYGSTAFLIFLTLKSLLQENLAFNKIFACLGFVAAVIWLVHPLHVEAVANIKGRDEIMSLLFSILSLNYATKYVDSKRSKDLVLIAILFFLGLLSKENTLTFLAIIPLAIWLFRKNSLKANIKIGSVLLLVSIIYLVIRISVVGFLFGGAPSDDLMNNSFAEMEGAGKYATILYTLLQYLKLHVFPHPLTHDYYPYHIPKMSFSDFSVWLSVGLHVILAAVMIGSYKKSKVICFSIGFYFLAMSIVSNLVVSIGTFMNERFVYSASLGFCLLFAFGFNKLNDRLNLKSKPIGFVPIGLLLIAFAAKTYQRVPVWQNPLTLNQAAIKVSKNSARANSFMATALFNKYKATTNPTEKMQLLQEAKPYADKAVEIHPSYMNGNLMKAGISSELYKADKNLARLLKTYDEILRVRPDVEFVTTYLEYLNPRENQQQLIPFYINIGQHLIAQGKYNYAIHFLKLGQSLNANSAEINSLIQKANNAKGQSNR